MFTLVIEYRVEDYAAWKVTFDRDPMGRAKHGVMGHRIQRDTANANHLMVTLEFGSAREAMRFRQMLRPVWDVSGAGQAWLLEDVETAA